MLRISTTESPDQSTTLRVEGQLTGAWIAELREACDRILARGQRLTLDLGDVSLIDRAGCELLASFSDRSVAFIHCSPFQEEQLRQAAAARHDTTPTP